MIVDLKKRRFQDIYNAYARQLIEMGRYVPEPPHQMKDAGEEWHTWELSHVIFRYGVTDDSEKLGNDISPNLPWAEYHFLERIGGEPVNPPPSHELWPYARAGNEDHMKDGKFSHTYPERMWPRYAGNYKVWPDTQTWGLRYRLGDLRDLVNLLAKEPHTRQAYLPIWFPEDLTAANEGERVPCTLGYHFMWRDGELDMTYLIRSCDFVRYFRDDVYMACRLLQWVSNELGFEVGSLMMHIISLHCFEGDLPLLSKTYAR